LPARFASVIAVSAIDNAYAIAGFSYSLTVPTDGKYKIGCAADEYETLTRAVKVEHKKANFNLK
jgi:hypothetical protein